MIPTDRYCHSGPSNGDNSILTKLSVMPFCHWGQYTLGSHASLVLCFSGIYKLRQLEHVDILHDNQDNLFTYI